MAQATPKRPRESFGATLRRSLFVIIVLSLLLAAAIGLTFYLRHIAKDRQSLHGAVPPVDLGLRPVEILSQEENSGSVLVETLPADPSYFDDALFVGDSLTEGIALYLPEYFTAVAVKGINTHTALTNPIFTTPEGQQLTLIETIEYFKPNKLYVMLGTNGLNWETIEWNYDGFVKLVEEVQMRIPGCSIVIMSCTPKTADAAAKVANYTPERIAEYNGLLRDLAISKGIYYLDIVPALADENGYLREDFAGADGIHMYPEGYHALKDYIYTHVIQGSMAFSFGSDGLLHYVAQIEPIDPEQTTVSDPGAVSPPAEQQGDVPAEPTPPADTAETPPTEGDAAAG